MFEELSPPYSTILVDPPWAYEGMSAPWRSTSEHTYSLMPLDEIKALPVADLAARDAHLYLWAVLPMMAAAYDVVDRWDFVPETVLTWCKPGPGLGGGYRGNTEHLIVARRRLSGGGVDWSSINPSCATCGGRARGAKKCACVTPDWRVKGQPVATADILRRPFRSTAEGTWYECPRGTHSAKPPLFADLIEQMSPGPYVELFARQPRLGWDSWGHGYEQAGVA
jgi:N6-adenosine-specific RNA methylase IME4